MEGREVGEWGVREGRGGRRGGEGRGGGGGGEGITDGVVKVVFMCGVWMNTLIGHVF